MNMNIDSSLLLKNHQEQQQVDRKLDKHDFLKILTTQLKTQTPMNPMKDRQFISQMATFTQLEQTINMTDLLEKFVSSQSTVSLGRQAVVIGKEITWQVPGSKSETGDKTLEKVSGVVKAVTFKDGQVKYVTTDGSEVKANSVIRISTEENQDDSAEQESSKYV